MKSIQILLVDDHAIVRQGYRSLLNDHPHLQVAAEAKSGEEAYSRYRDNHVDVVVLDLSLPGKGGLATLIQLLQYDPNARVLVFTMHLNPNTAIKVMQAGARGYITKSSDPECLIDAVNRVMQGDIVLSDDIKEQMALTTLADKDLGLAKLSAREYEILGLLVEGKSKQQIADILCISFKTVSNCHYIIKRKLAVNTDIELMRAAIKLGLIAKACDE
ncbi:MAG: DNA-binding response regulator [Oceanospirillaceae bacterium]|nr:DNA-binding response regulator [Oceanospirillaceae bacterium]